MENSPNRSNHRFVIIDAEALALFSCAELGLFAHLLRWAVDGKLRRSMRKLVEDTGATLSWVQRHIALLKAKGCFANITRLADGSFVYEIAPRFLPPPRRIATATGRLTSETRVIPSSGFYKKPSEGEREHAPDALSEGDEIPDGWIEAATTERRRADLPDVNLNAEWRKLVIHAAGAAISRARWLMWAMRARLDRTNIPSPAASATPVQDTGTAQQHARLSAWIRTGKWAPAGITTWGPPPDESGCQLPPALIAWALKARQEQTEEERTRR